MVSPSKTILTYSDGNVLLSSHSNRDGTFAIVNPDFNQIWKMTNEAGEPVVLKNLDRNSRNEILMGKKQGAGYDAPSGQAVPATARFLDDSPVAFTQDLQTWFHYVLNGGKAVESQAKRDFAQCFRDNAWCTNNAGSWSRKDYINNNAMPPFIQIQPMATGGALLKIVAETSHKRQPAYLVEAINPLDGYAKYSPSSHRWLFYRPTISARVRISTSGKVTYQCWYQEPVNSWYGEKMEFPVFGFIKDTRSSTGWANLIEADRVRILSSTDRVPTPYILRSGRILPNPYAEF